MSHLMRATFGLPLLFSRGDTEPLFTTRSLTWESFARNLKFSLDFLWVLPVTLSVSIGKPRIPMGPCWTLLLGSIAASVVTGTGIHLANSSGVAWTAFCVLGFATRSFAKTATTLSPRKRRNWDCIMS